MRRISALVARFIGLGGIVAAIAAPAQASTTEHAAFEQARNHGTIEAFEDFLYKHPRSALRAAVIGELARFECSQGMRWKCGRQDTPRPAEPHRGQYGG